VLGWLPQQLWSTCLGWTSHISDARHVGANHAVGAGASSSIHPSFHCLTTYWNLVVRGAAALAAALVQEPKRVMEIGPGQPRGKAPRAAEEGVKVSATPLFFASGGTSLLGRRYFSLVSLVLMAAGCQRGPAVSAIPDQGGPAARPIPERAAHILEGARSL